ncbi:hypothetical protein ACFP51_12750 [Streptomyces pratens]|uniref:Cupin domain-containing protein n=1 Tax=Streptomyces pratens TaxID=887456 RepID=A0ABW1M0I4_9ACTN
MNLPVDAPAAFPEGGPADGAAPGTLGPGEAHLRELAVFLTLHLGRAPGVLWPEHDHPAFDERPGADRAPEGTSTPDTLAAGIAAATGMAARLVAAGMPPGHLLVHQIEGAASWSLAGTRDDGGGTSLRYRLRAGEVLYVPDGWSRTAEPTPDARWTVVLLTVGGEADTRESGTGAR